jgi:hypothetical protein
MSTVLYQKIRPDDHIAGRPRGQPWFYVGQKLVCVDASINPKGYPRKLLTAGRIYEVRAIDQRPGWKAPHWGVHLKGIQIFYPDATRRLEWAMHPRRFRPVVERPTSIKSLEEMLAVPADIERQLRDEMKRHTVTTMRALATDFAPQMELFQEFGPIPARKGSRRKLR